MLDTIQSAALEIGQLCGLDDEGHPLVLTQRTQEGAPERCWLAVALTEIDIFRLSEHGDRVLLARPDELNGAAVIVGVLRQRADTNVPPAELVLEASERLVVRCGTARIVLFGDGRCEVHAERISQRARGVHAIKGAAVRIN